MFIQNLFLLYGFMLVSPSERRGRPSIPVSSGHSLTVLQLSPPRPQPPPLGSHRPGRSAPCIGRMGVACPSYLTPDSSGAGAQRFTKPVVHALPAPPPVGPSVKHTDRRSLGGGGFVATESHARSQILSAPHQLDEWVKPTAASSPVRWGYKRRPRRAA